MEPQQERKNKLEIFKYNAILSALFFLGSTFYLSGQLPNYNFTKYTISQMSYFLNSNQLSFFNLLFIIKSLLDLSFTAYVFKKFELKLNALTSAIWLIAVLSFGLIGFFPVNKFFVIHWLLAGGLFIFWTISEHVFAKLTKSKGFLYLSNNLILIQAIIILLFFTFSKINAIFEIIYFLLALFWQVIFISRYL
ncbi:hypothetical protein COY13_00115 [Candidatus Roizmanbacteria bacterium CG_4_10_14_0_2_um_filter_36_35]|uniref:DUF998 domain-containing protein n=4 Tax=Candidatus Roizmaniibacteriota TaxID=1752723 RepID=A0A2M7BW76_9BACT|nr:MAG: hypothetical protein COV86_00665 [Candidatus Roizmanbacteria bacterium CG11_big_fil_rev_8_21_14_0_20_35_14]PIV10801.1 MAG: hypothetical protein COS50_03525 [Candidatus Roizmanbacteria bacterium CG03_land_8_20_14_0_80_35_26]PIZ68967.1 MAG: hypothetical protein COY13_00115 [Candidatus Roizmanbacteria bacterium CG_4_10_14_0_2_um_filter_36_35]PJC32464.1 MAG: hypothetical protein CO049_02910 [Candidatus Roizmanbacteria bacterium CG_4_9_14_0_2_um_filter_36_12]PJC80072.1 MAG: hypothetical prot